MILDFRFLKNKSTLVILCILMVVPFLLQAQLLGNDLALNVEPQSVGAFEDVEIIATSFSLDLNRSTLSWYVNGELRAQGIGKNSFNFTTESLGTNFEVSVSIVSPYGEEISQSIDIKPAEIDLLWQAHTYTPPLYKGKARPTAESLLKIVAIPNFVNEKGGRLEPGSLVYVWEQDGVVLGRLSGLGRDSVVVRAPLTSRTGTSISVTVTSFEKDISMQKSISLRTEEASVGFYEKHPLEGILYARSLGDNFVLSEKEVTLRAEPFGFSLDDIQDGELKYSWKANRENVSSSPENVQEIVLRQESEDGGAADISLSIENLGKLLQLAQNTIRVQF
jgi:hypothetical protein